MDDFIGQILHLFLKDLDYKHSLMIFGLVMARIMVIITLVPFLGARNAPGPVKMGLGVTLTLVLWPAAMSTVSGDLSLGTLEFILLMLKEVFVGFAIGFVTAEIFYAVEISGQLMDVLRATNQIQLMVPELGQRSSAFGTLTYQLLLAIFMAAGYHVFFFDALVDSFLYLPIDRWPPFSQGFWAFTDAFIHLLAEIFLIGLTLALPVGIVSLVLDTGFGLMNRIAPQINAYFMSLPAKSLGGVVLFFFAFSMALEQYAHYSGVLLQRLFQVIELMK